MIRIKYGECIKLEVLSRHTSGPMAWAGRFMSPAWDGVISVEFEPRRSPASYLWCSSHRLSVCLSSPFLLSQLSSGRQVAETGLGGDGEPCPLLSHLPWPCSLSKQPRGLLRCCISEKRSSLAKQIQPRRKATPCKRAPGPPKGDFLGLAFNFLNWPQAKNVSWVFFRGPSPPPTPSLASAVPRVLISHRRGGRPQKWPGGAQLAGAILLAPTEPWEGWERVWAPERNGWDWSPSLAAVGPEASYVPLCASVSKSVKWDEDSTT